MIARHLMRFGSWLSGTEITPAQFFLVWGVSMFVGLLGIWLSAWYMSQ